MEALLAKPVGVIEARAVAIAAIAQNGDDRVARTEAPGRLHRGRHVDTHRTTQEQALLPEQLVDGVQGRLVVDPHGVIDGSAFQVGRNPAVANALGDRAALSAEDAGLDPAVEGAAAGIGQHAAHGGVLLL